MIENPLILFVALPLAAYVIGSTPFGVLMARAHGKDLRALGSGNVGATNCGRVLGKGWGCLCFVLDVGKGFGPALAAVLLTRRPDGAADVLAQLAWLGVGLGAICGHVFSFWLGFRGGKGVATALGFVLGTYPYLTWAGLAAMGVWIVVTLISRYVSMGSIAAALAFPPLMAAFNWPPSRCWPMMIFAVGMVALIIVRHRGNIRRLLDGTENKIGARRTGGATGDPDPGPPEGSR